MYIVVLQLDLLLCQVKHDIYSERIKFSVETLAYVQYYTSIRDFISVSWYFVFVIQKLASRLIGNVYYLVVWTIFVLFKFLCI